MIDVRRLVLLFGSILGMVVVLLAVVIASAYGRDFRVFQLSEIVACCGMLELMVFARRLWVREDKLP